VASAAVQDGERTEIGVQHVGQVVFSGFGCTYIGRSGPSGNRHFAASAITGGSGCPNAMVRAWVCTGAGYCYTSSWRSGSAPEYWAPVGHRIVTSFHKCTGCTLTHEIDH
jgi:hypothetical protein